MPNFLKLIHSLDTNEPDAPKQPVTPVETRKQRRQKERNANRLNQGVKTKAKAQDPKNKAAS